VDPGPQRHHAAVGLDEIAGGLTDGDCKALIDTIKGLHAQGTTIIWIEHVLHALNSVVERLLVLDFGRVIGIGDPVEIMASKEVREIYLGMEV
jgi:branched-chain amino acid transport system ATP-binding protein